MAGVKPVDVVFVVAVVFNKLNIDVDDIVSLMVCTVETLICWAAC